MPFTKENANEMRVKGVIKRTERQRVINNKCRDMRNIKKFGDKGYGNINEEQRCSVSASPVPLETECPPIPPTVSSFEQPPERQQITDNSSRNHRYRCNSRFNATMNRLPVRPKPASNSRGNKMLQIARKKNKENAR